MNQSDHRAESWDTCEEGVLSRFAETENRRQWLSKQKRFVVAVASVCVIAVAAWSVITQLDDMQIRPPINQVAETPPWIEGMPGGISCEDVLGRVEEYFAGDMNDELRERVVSHIDHCQYCKEQYQQMADAVGESLVSNESLPSSAKKQSPSLLHSPQSPFAATQPVVALR